MSNTFTLYHPRTSNSTIVVGTNGFRINLHNDSGWPLAPIFILFDGIRYVGVITGHQNNITSFSIDASTLENKRDVNHYEIKVSGSILELHDLITQGYNQACNRKDTLLGIV